MGESSYILKRDTSDHASKRTIKILIARFAEEGDARQKAREALDDIGEPAVPLLVEALSSLNPQVRWESAKTLGKIGSPMAIPALIARLEDKDFDVRWLSTEALIDIGPDCLVPLLRRIIEKPDDIWIQQCAHHILSHMAGNDVTIEHHRVAHPRIAGSRFQKLLMPVVTALEGAEPEITVPVVAKKTLDYLT